MHSQQSADPYYHSKQKPEHRTFKSAEILEERPNIELIKQVETPAKPEFTLKPVDPIMRLQGIINKVTAKRFSEVGTLTEEEKAMYSLP